jgi:beta-galactosidase
MYKLVSKLYENGKVLLDQYETPFGFRWVEWTADKGFFLNGEHYYFKGQTYTKTTQVGRVP